MTGAFVGGLLTLGLSTAAASVAAALVAAYRRGYDAGHLEGIRATAKGYNDRFELEVAELKPVPPPSSRDAMPCPANDDVRTGHRFVCCSCGHLVFAAVHFGPSQTCMLCQFSSAHGLPISRADSGDSR